MKRQHLEHHKQPPVKRNRRTLSPPSTSNPKTPPLPKRRQKALDFPTYLNALNLSPTARFLSEMIATSPCSSIENFFQNANLHVTQSDVEQVLKLSYHFPVSAVKFFRWAASILNNNHSPYSWNLVVDLLGKNCLFDAMWDAIKSMRHNESVSLATFASVFSSYVIANRVKDAIKSFEVMDQYNCERDIVSLNTLLSAICRDGRTVDACEFLKITKMSIQPDCDSYAILLEGWEKEMDVAGARETFAEMVIEIGWNPVNVPAYDAFLCTLIRGPDGLVEAMKDFDSMKKRQCFPGVKFLTLSLSECLKGRDVKTAGLLWKTIEDKIELRRNIELYNMMISLHCHANHIEVAKKFYSVMLGRGLVPDVQTYNVLFQFFVKSKMLPDATVLFGEMGKNKCVLNQKNCRTAVKVFINSMDPYMALKVWKVMVDHYDSDLEETGNFLIVGLCELHKLPEAVKCAEGMIEKGIHLASSSLSKLRRNLGKARKYRVCEELDRKLKAP